MTLTETTKAKLPTTVADLNVKLARADRAVRTARQELQELEAERAALAVPAFEGDETASKKLRGLDERIRDQAFNLRTATTAYEELQRQVAAERERQEQEERARHEREVAALKKERAEHLEAGNKAFGRLTRAIRAAVLETDPKLRDAGETIPTPAQALDELRSRYTERLERVLETVLEESRPEAVRKKIKSLISERSEAAAEQEDARRTAHQISGSSPMGASGEAWHRYYQAEDAVKAIDRALMLLQQSEHPERILAQLEASSSSAERDGGDGAPARGESGGLNSWRTGIRRCLVHDQATFSAMDRCS